MVRSLADRTFQLCSGQLLAEGRLRLGHLDEGRCALDEAGGARRRRVDLPEAREGRVAVEDRDGLRDGGFLPRAEHVALLELLRLGGAALRERREEP